MKDRKHSYEFRLLSIANCGHYHMILPAAEMSRTVCVVSMCNLLVINLLYQQICERLTFLPCIALN
jgi:hypothetical protein